MSLNLDILTLQKTGHVNDLTNQNARKRAFSNLHIIITGLTRGRWEIVPMPAGYVYCVRSMGQSLACDELDDFRNDLAVDLPRYLVK